MQTRRDGRYGEVSSAYSSEQVESVLNECGVEIVADYETDFLCFCPYHGNKYTPSFSISKTTGAFICFNASCGEVGALPDLIQHTTNRNPYEALRLIARAKTENIQSALDQVQKILNTEPLPTFPQWILDKQYANFWYHPEALAYMEGRGFDKETLDHFKVGYSLEVPASEKYPYRPPMVSVPMHSVDGRPVGVIGRSILQDDKTFKNSKGLPTGKSLYNIHRAKRAANTVIIVEASFDAMLIHQDGYPNVVGCLGGNFSPYHAEQLDRYFDTIIIMTDFDDSKKHIYQGCKKCVKAGFKTCIGHNPGRALGEKIADTMRGKTIKWASYGDGIVYPEGAKDPGDMTSEQRIQCIKEAVSNFEYHRWGIEKA